MDPWRCISCWKLWFSIAILVYQRVNQISNLLKFLDVLGFCCTLASTKSRLSITISGNTVWCNSTWRHPIGSMYGIFTYIWLIFMVNVGKYAIHGSNGHEANEKPNAGSVLDVFLFGSFLTLSYLECPPDIRQAACYTVILREISIQGFEVSNEKNPGCLGYRGDYTTQLSWDY